MSLRSFARELVPPILLRGWRAMRSTNGMHGPVARSLDLDRLRAVALGAPRWLAGTCQLGSLAIQYTDLLSLFMEYKDIFGNQIYHFDTTSQCPDIIDGGACIGMATLYWKQLYPQARITCFEPDPELVAVLRRNLEANGIEGVSIVDAGLAEAEGTVRFTPDGADGGRIRDDGSGQQIIRTVPLSKYLDRPVDFLKLNIEGREWPVLREAEASGRLRNVREIVIEYHGWPGYPQRLGSILDVLDRQGYRYLVHDFDCETNAGSKPPFRIGDQTTWFALVYARRIE